MTRTAIDTKQCSPRRKEAVAMALDRRTKHGNGKLATGSSPAVKVPGKRTLTESLDGKPTQRMANQPANHGVQAAAARGVATPASPLPYADSIQRLFGRHDISSVQAHTGPGADAAARDMGARGFATGNHIVLGGGADKFTVAHEAAHVVQQRGGVQLKGGVGETGDRYEQHADEVAALVVNGQSAEAALDRYAGSSGGSAAVQRDDDPSAPNECVEPNQSIAPPEPNQSVAPPASKPEGGGEKPEGPEVEMETAFPQIGPFGITMGVTSKGEASISGSLSKELPSFEAPVCTGVYIEVKPELQGSIGITGDSKAKTYSGAATLSTSVGASLRGGLPHIASVGGGAELTGTASFPVVWSAGAGWSAGPVKISLSGAPFVSGEIGETEFKATIDPLEVLVITIGLSGVAIAPGPHLAEAIFGADRKAQEADPDDGGGSEGAGNTPQQPDPPPADAGSGGAGGAGNAYGADWPDLGM